MNKAEYTLKELSKEHGISIKDLRAYVNQGQLNASKIGRSYIVRRSDLNTFLKSDALVNRVKKDDTIPTRNYLCASYDKCLNKAAIANTLFDCQACNKFAQAKSRILSQHEMSGIVSLWESVFGKEVYCA